MPNQAAPCRFYALGHCQKGSACTFSHSNEKQVCQFYLAGNCSYGSKCVNKHDKSFKKVGISSKQNTSTAIKSKPVVPISVPPKQSKQSAWGKNSNQDTSNRTQNPSSNSETLLCPFKKSDCKWGINCKSIHGDICPSCDLPVLDPTNPSSHQTHLDSCKNSLQLNDQDQECVVCYEAVKKDGKGVFGLLDCVHVACYGCISQWRGVEKQVGSKTCPICRVSLDLILDYNLFCCSLRDLAKG